MRLPKIVQVSKNVYLVTFNLAYDVAMTFLRYQEYYESPKWRGQLFTISDYMAWYSKGSGEGSFTYPTDYNGFNLPSKVVKRVQGHLWTEKYDAITPYDRLMGEIYETILNKRDGYGFYLIGVSKETGDTSTIKHEIAHGMYTTDKEYKFRVDRLIRELSPRIKKRIFKALGGRQYHKAVFKDELNAYMATWIRPEMRCRGIKRAREPFQQLFKEFYIKNKVR